MSLLKSLFGSKESSITTNEEFWQWFTIHADEFHKQVKKGNTRYRSGKRLLVVLNFGRGGFDVHKGQL